MAERLHSNTLLGAKRNMKNSKSNTILIMIRFVDFRLTSKKKSSCLDAEFLMSIEFSDMNESVKWNLNAPVSCRTAKG